MDDRKIMNEIYVSHYLDFLKKIPSESVDLCFADPPFNLGKKYKNYKDNKAEDFYLLDCSIWISELIRVLKPSGSLFIHHIPYWLGRFVSLLEKQMTFKHWIVWDAPSMPMGKSLQPNHYGILYYVKDEKQNKFYEIRSLHKRCRICKKLIKDYGGKKNCIHPFGPLLSDVWTDIHRIKHNKYRDDHPCQLPLCLLERIILMASDEKDIILDPFIGTGTTALASKRLGRQYLGCDISEEYVNIAKGKLEKENRLSVINEMYLSVSNLKDISTIRDCDVMTDNFKDLFINFPKDGDFSNLSYKALEYRDEIKKKLRELV